MKRILISIILIAFAMPAAGQWSKANRYDQVLAIGVHDSTLFLGIAPQITGEPLIYRTTGGCWCAQDWIGSDTGISRSQGNITSFASLGKYFYAGTSGGYAYVSTDNGSNWKELMNGPVFTNGEYLFTSSSTTVYRSTDTGNNWEAVTCPGTLNFAAIGINIFANTGNAIWRSRDTGNTWTKLSALLVGPMTPMDSLLFIVENGSVAKSTDSGTTWSKVTVDSAGVAMYVNCLATDGKNLFAGTTTGFLYSTDTGKTWTEKNDSITSYDIFHDTHIFPENVEQIAMFDSLVIINVYYAGKPAILGYYLFKRSIRDLIDSTKSEVAEVSESDTLEIYPNPATGMVTISNGTQILGITVVNVLGTGVIALPKINQASISVDLGKEPSGTYFFEITTPNGIFLRKLVKE